MTPNRSWFEDFCEQAEGFVLFGDNKSCKIAGIGSIWFKLHDGNERLLTEVRYVPDLKRNLISVGELDKKGYLFKGENSELLVVKGSVVVIRGIKKKGLYSLDGDVVIGTTTSAFEKLSQKTEIWHKRLGHVSERGLIE